MTAQQSKGKSRKNHKGAEKTLSMEEKSPTMPSVFNKGLHITGRYRRGQDVIYYAELADEKKPLCPHCGGKSYAHGKLPRKLDIMNKDGGVRDCRLTLRRFKCCSCGKTFQQDLWRIGVAPYARRNERMNKAMGRQMMQGVSNKDIANNFRVNPSTVERALHRLFKLHLKERLNYPCPVYLGIDEHSIHKGKHYAVTLIDLKNHRVYEVIDGKQTATLEAALRKLRGRSEVKMVCMDLCPQFRSIVRRLFPKAKIVADRFHVIRLVIDTLLDFSREAEPDIRWQRGIIAVLRKNGANLTTKQKTLLENVLLDKPILRPAYEFKEELCALLRNKDQKEAECQAHLCKLKYLMEQMEDDSTSHFKALHKTMRSWYEPIIRMWRFTYNNGITEGFHRKMKLIQRRAYGFRNFANYRLRVLVECSGSGPGDKNNGFHTLCA